MKAVLALALLWLGATLSATAQSLQAKQGNISFASASGEVRQLTTSGLDSAPVLSPDGLTVAFIRATPGRTVMTALGLAEVTELWTIGTDGEGAKRIVQGGERPKPRRPIAGMENPQFSPDGRVVYFESVSAVVSGAVYAAELANKAETRVCSGHTLQVVRSGRYTGHLVVQQHRYFVQGGSYDWFWLLRPDGVEVGPIGEDLENFWQAYQKERPARASASAPSK